jgi:type II secretory pathway component GspD/PulD (secretin)
MVVQSAEAEDFQAIPRLQPKVSVDFVETDIHDVLKALAMQAKMNIIASPDVKGDLTISMENVTVEEALNMVTSLSGFKFALVNGSYVVGTQENLKSLMTSGMSVSSDVRVTEVIAIRYADPTVVTSIVEKECGMVQISNNTSATKDSKSPAGGPSFLVLTGSPDNVRAAKALVTGIEQSAAVIAESTLTEIYEVKYANISELPALLMASIPGLQATIGPGQGFNLACPSAVQVSADISSGQSQKTEQKATSKMLILRGTQDEIDKAKEFLAQLDIQQPQIMIEAKVIDLNNDASKDLGITYEWGDSTTTFNEDRTTDTTMQALSIGRISRTALSLDATLTALVESGQGRLLASPNVLALDGKPASVFIGDEVKYVISIQESQNGIMVQTETAKVGIQLHCISSISSDGYITMNLHPEVSVIKGWIELPITGFSLPEISRRYIDSTVRVKDGETIVIGGLMKDEEIKTMSGIPLLKDLPIIGGFFRNNKTEKNHSEIMMLITPRVFATT